MGFVAFKKTAALFTVSLLLFPSLAEGVAWKNLDKEHRLAGRMVSEGYLRGKVVLVDRWGRNCPPCRALLPRLEELWQSYKMKPFVLLGGHCKGWGTPDQVKALAEKLNLSYPIYEGAGLAENEPEYDGIPFLYLVDETGRVRYKGHDERAATERLVMLLTDMEAPKDLAEWKYFLDFELKMLPGRGYLRLLEFRKKFPQEAKAYDEDYRRLKAEKDLPKLVKLVAFAKMAKDFDPKNKKTKGKITKDRVAQTLKAYDALRENPDERIAQEAKNAIADLTWAMSNL